MDAGCRTMCYIKLRERQPSSYNRRDKFQDQRCSVGGSPEAGTLGNESPIEIDKLRSREPNAEWPDSDARGR